MASRDRCRVRKHNRQPPAKSFIGRESGLFTDQSPSNTTLDLFQIELAMPCDMLVASSAFSLK
jgi:hypothetical protein